MSVEVRRRRRLLYGAAIPRCNIRRARLPMSYRSPAWLRKQRLRRVRRGSFDPDLGEGENGVGDQDFVRPCLPGAGVDDRVDAVLFEHDVPLNGGATLIFASLHEPVSVGRARAQHLEDDYGGINNGLAAGQRRANNNAVGVAGVVLFGLDFEIAAEELARLTAETGGKSESEIAPELLQFARVVAPPGDDAGFSVTGVLPAHRPHLGGRQNPDGVLR